MYIVYRKMNVAPFPCAKAEIYSVFYHTCVIEFVFFSFSPHIKKCVVLQRQKKYLMWTLHHFQHSSLKEPFEFFFSFFYFFLAKQMIFLKISTISTIFYIFELISAAWRIHWGSAPCRLACWNSIVLGSNNGLKVRNRHFLYVWQQVLWKDMLWCFRCICRHQEHSGGTQECIWCVFLWHLKTLDPDEISTFLTQQCFRPSRLSTDLAETLHVGSSWVYPKWLRPNPSTNAMGGSIVVSKMSKFHRDQEFSNVTKKHTRCIPAYPRSVPDAYKCI
jgi:hypothetical protein